MPKSAEEQGQILREFRVTAWLSTAEQGHALDLTPNAIVQWESGRSKPSLQLLAQLAELWDAPLELIQHELGYEVALPLVDGEPYTVGRWHDAIRAKRCEERTLNSFTHRSGAARAKRKGTAGGGDQGSGIPYISVRSDDHRARASA